MLKSSYGIDFTLENAGTFGCELLAICGCQHMFGAMLCVPAVFPFVADALGISRDVAIFMANNGALSEVGWEIGDLINRFFERVILGRTDLQPNSIIAIMTLHHTLGMVMVIPMTTYYGSHPNYLEMVILLQFAAALGLSMQQFGFMLDITKPGELLQMKGYVTVTFFCMVYTRGIRFCAISFE